MPNRAWELSIEWLLRLGLGGLFLFAGVAKLRDPSAFALEIAHYQFFPSLAPYLAASLPATEVLLGAALIASPRRWRKAAAVGLMALLAVFTIAVTQVVVRGINIECGCFGGATGPVTSLTIARDVGLFAAALFYYFVADPEPRAQPVSAP